MSSMFGIPMEIPEQFRDQIPLESSDASEYIKFTKLVLDLIKQISQEGASQAVPKKKYTKGATKRTRGGEPVQPGEESKVGVATVLLLAKIASNTNTTKITHVQVQEDQPMDPKEAEVRLKDQLSMLMAIEKNEQKLRAYAARSKKQAEPVSKTREEMRSEKLASLEENTVIGLKDALEKMDRAFHSLEPFTIEGLSEKIGKDIKNKEQITSALSRTLQAAHNAFSEFCAEYFRATGLANTLKSPYGEKVRELVADIDNKFGKLPLVKTYMKSLADFDKALEQKKQAEVHAQTFFSRSAVHGREEIKPSPDINTQALLAGQQKQMEFQQEQAEETRRELARGRGLQYFGLFGQLVVASTSLISAGGEVGGALGSVGGAAVSGTLMSKAGAAVATTAIGTQVPTWGKTEWLTGAAAFLVSYGMLYAADYCGIPVSSPYLMATLLTTLVTSPFSLGIHKVLSYRRPAPESYQWGASAGKVGQGNLAKVHNVLLECAKTYAEANPAKKEGPPAKKPKVDAM